MITIEEAKQIIDTDYTGIHSSNNIKLNIDGEVPFIELEGFKEYPFIRHGFSTRLGGVSEGIYESLNLDFKRQDKKENVIENYRRLCSSIGVDFSKISSQEQIHEAEVLVVSEEDAGITHEGYDAQITNCKNIPLIVYTADCVPMLFMDPVSRVIGVAHGGWRGTVKGIAAKTVEKMTEVYGCLPENIHVAIGPSIGPDNYEVDESVIKQVVECPYLDTTDDNVTFEPVQNTDFKYIVSSGTYVRDNMPEGYKGVVLTRRGVPYEIFRTVKIIDKYMLNLWNLNELILVNSGIRMSNIYQTKLCTMKYHDLFFSHRYTNGERGLCAGIISLV